MLLMPPPKSLNSCPICFLPLARPHFGKNTCASSANRSRMLPPVDVLPPLSNALRYSSATDLRCSSVIVPRVTVTRSSSLTTPLDFRAHRPELRVEPEALAVPAAAQRSDEHAGSVERQRRDVAAERGHQPVLHQIHLDVREVERR